MKPNLSLTDSVRLRLVLHIRIYMKNASYVIAQGYVAVAKARPAVAPHARFDVPKSGTNDVQALSKRCPSAVQAPSKLYPSTIIFHPSYVIAHGCRAGLATKPTLEMPAQVPLI